MWPRDGAAPLVDGAVESEASGKRYPKPPRGGGRGAANRVATLRGPRGTLQFAVTPATADRIAQETQLLEHVDGYKLTVVGVQALCIRDSYAREDEHSLLCLGGRVVVDVAAKVRTPPDPEPWAVGAFLAFEEARERAMTARTQNTQARAGAGTWEAVGGGADGRGAGGGAEEGGGGVRASAAAGGGQAGGSGAADGAPGEGGGRGLHGRTRGLAHGGARPHRAGAPGPARCGQRRAARHSGSDSAGGTREQANKARRRNPELTRVEAEPAAVAPTEARRGAEWAELNGAEVGRRRPATPGRARGRRGSEQRSGEGPGSDGGRRTGRRTGGRPHGCAGRGPRAGGARGRGDGRGV